MAMAFTRFWQSHFLSLPLLARSLMSSHCCYYWMHHHPLLVPLTLPAFLESHFIKLFSVNLSSVPFVSWLNHEARGQGYIVLYFCLYICCLLYLECLLPFFFASKLLFLLWVSSKILSYKKPSLSLSSPPLPLLGTSLSYNSIEPLAYRHYINFHNVLIGFVGMSPTQFKAHWGLNIFYVSKTSWQVMDII